METKRKAAVIRKALSGVANVRVGSGSMRGLVLVFLKNLESAEDSSFVLALGGQVVHRGFYVIGNLSR